MEKHTAILLMLQNERTLRREAADVHNELADKSFDIKCEAMGKEHRALAEKQIVLCEFADYLVTRVENVEY